MASDLEINRFKILPTEEDMEKIKTLFKKKDYRFLYIDEVVWYNHLTRRKGPVRNVPLLATYNDSDRPVVITEMYIDTKEKDTGRIRRQQHYVFNKDYHHVNIQDSTGHCTFDIIDDEDSSKYHHFELYVHEVCTPITRHHFFLRTEQQLTALYKGQLVGQNTGSPYRTVRSVANNYFDAAIKDLNGEVLKKGAPIAQLLTRQPLNALRNINTLRTSLEALSLPKDESEVLIKQTHNANYTLCKASRLDDEDIQNTLSCYYPIIKYEHIKAITSELPDEEIDVACFGLGSAGSAILDQLSRSNLVKSYFLYDYDVVETKNLRNQFYTTGSIGNYKTSSAKEIIRRNKCGGECDPIITPIQAKLKETDDDSTNSPFKHRVFKYVLSAFDSIDVRLILFNKIKNKIIKAKYLIDTRYEDLASSIFIINTEDEKEMKFYEENLLETKKLLDEEALKNAPFKTEDEFIQYIKDKNIFVGGCANLKAKLGLSTNCHSCSCGNDRCLNYFKEEYKANPIKIMKKAIALEHPSSCIRKNIIDIYKYTGTFVFGAIRSIETDNKKLFTYIEASTETLPQYMILRK